MTQELIGIGIMLIVIGMILVFVGSITGIGKGEGKSKIEGAGVVMIE
ncbi:MAG: hypothetical protein ABIE23_06420 [archaeon]